jgi:hypothetical protein
MLIGMPGVLARGVVSLWPMMGTPDITLRGRGGQISGREDVSACYVLGKSAILIHDRK